VTLVWHQFRYDQKAFWRNPASVFFTVMFPVVLLLIFATVFGDQTVDVRGGIETTAYYVPAIITLAVISATMQSLAMSLVIAREDGRLKRGRGTPMPAWVFIAGRVGNSAVVALLMLALLALIGRVLYGVAIPWGQMPQIVVTLLIGASAFLPGRGGADRQRAALAALLPLRRLHPRRPAPQRRHPLRRHLPDPPFLRGLLRRL
jgi:ABC-2 type transport system permease protein